MYVLGERTHESVIEALPGTEPMTFSIEADSRYENEDFRLAKGLFSAGIVWGFENCCISFGESS